MKKVTPLVVMLVAGLLSVADFPLLQAAKTPPRITRDGLFKAIEIGGLTEEDLIGLIKDYGVDFQCAAEDERKLAAAKIGVKVVEALRANYRVVPVKTAPAMTERKADPAAATQPESDEIVAGGQSSSPAIKAPAVEAEAIVAGGAQAAAAPAVVVEEEVVAGGTKPLQQQAPAVVDEEEVVAGGAKPPQLQQLAPAVVEEEVVAGGAKPPQQQQQSPAVVEEEVVAGGAKPPQTQPPAVQAEQVVAGSKPVLVAQVAPPPSVVSAPPEPVLIAAPPQDIPAGAAALVTPTVAAPSNLPQQIAAAAPAVSQPEFIPASPQRKVFPTVPAGLAPFVKGTHVVKVRVQIDERGAVQAAHVLSMTGEPSETVARIATQSAQKWQFTPAQTGGKAVSSEQVLRFVL